MHSTWVITLVCVAIKDRGKPMELIFVFCVLITRDQTVRETETQI
jgi:hypothetical protein